MSREREMLATFVAAVNAAGGIVVDRDGRGRIVGVDAAVVKLYVDACVELNLDERIASDATCVYTLGSLVKPQYDNVWSCLVASVDDEIVREGSYAPRARLKATQRERVLLRALAASHVSDEMLTSIEGTLEWERL